MFTIFISSQKKGRSNFTNKRTAVIVLQNKEDNKKKKINI